MTAYNVVRFRVKPGKERAFEDFHRSMHPDFEGFAEAALIKTGDRTYCFVGKWKDFDSIAAARPQMIGLLDQTRAMLEDLGGGMGLTDAVSGSAVVEMTPGKR